MTFHCASQGVFSLSLSLRALWYVLAVKFSNKCPVLYSCQLTSLAMELYKVPWGPMRIIAHDSDGWEILCAYATAVLIRVVSKRGRGWSYRSV